MATRKWFSIGYKTDTNENVTDRQLITTDDAMRDVYKRYLENSAP